MNFINNIINLAANFCGLNLFELKNIKVSFFYTDN